MGILDIFYKEFNRHRGKKTSEQEMKKGAYGALDKVLAYYTHKWNALRDSSVSILRPSIEEIIEFMSITSEDIIKVISVIDRIIDKSHIKTLNDIVLKIKKFERKQSVVYSKNIEECNEISKKVEDLRNEISSYI